MPGHSIPADPTGLECFHSSTAPNNGNGNDDVERQEMHVCINHNHSSNGYRFGTRGTRHHTEIRRPINNRPILFFCDVSSSSSPSTTSTSCPGLSRTRDDSDDGGDRRYSTVIHLCRGVRELATFPTVHSDSRVRVCVCFQMIV